MGSNFLNFLPGPDDRYGLSPAPRSGVGTSGDLRGTSGAPEWRRAYAVTAGLLAFACAVNIASRWHDARAGVALWRVALSEASSITAVIAFAWIAFLARDRARGLGPARGLGVQAAAASVFSVAHCLGMWTLRRLVLTAAGFAYGWSVTPGQFFYEFRKDVFTYTVIALIYRGFEGMNRPAIAPAAGAAPAPLVSGTTDIRDGARLWRVPTREILAVLSAGNYVEFVMADGRRLMMRATLAGVGADLAHAGFVRVHRSWVVNVARVHALAPETSGDYILTVEGGMTVPLSRRFPEALAALKNGDLEALPPAAAPPGATGSSAIGERQPPSLQRPGLR